MKRRTKGVRKLPPRSFFDPPADSVDPCDDPTALWVLPRLEMELRRDRFEGTPSSSQLSSFLLSQPQGALGIGDRSRVSIGTGSRTAFFAVMVAVGTRVRRQLAPFLTSPTRNASASSSDFVGESHRQHAKQIWPVRSFCKHYQPAFLIQLRLHGRAGQPIINAEPN